MMRRSSFALVMHAALIMLTAWGTASPADRRAPAAAVAPALVDQPVALDPEIKRGGLANGVTYYVRKPAKPEQRAALWLAVDAGSVLEDDDQRGVAHLVEHMAFDGTRR